jgi:predicted transcriptional regulator YdeE
MDTQKIESFNIIGIAVRTTNEEGQSGKDIPLLWEKFMTEEISKNIPSKVDESVYCIYTDYEKDHTKPYTTLLGCKVANLANIPEGMIGKTFESGKYHKIIVKGNLLEGVVFQEWLKIWNSMLPRAYTADFEVYGAKSQNPTDAEIEIFLAVK